MLLDFEFYKQIFREFFEKYTKPVIITNNKIIIGSDQC